VVSCPANAAGAPSCTCNSGFTGTLSFSGGVWSGTCTGKHVHLFAYFSATTCSRTGARRTFSTRASTCTGCWLGNPCPYDAYSFDPTQGVNFQALGQYVQCSAAAPTCVANVGIGTYTSTTTCQGTWQVLCNGVSLGTISTIGRTCTGSSMTNSCRLTFSARLCTSIRLVATTPNNGALGCCNGAAPDAMIVAVSVW